MNVPLSGAPARITIRGLPLARFDTIAHEDGTLWRYEGMCRENIAVVASVPGQPGDRRRFAKQEFGIVVAAGKGLS